MPLYFSSHTTACLTKQELRRLLLELLADQEVKVQRCVASQIAGRMLTEIEASDQATLERWFQARHINIQWVMRVELDAQDGEVRER